MNDAAFQPKDTDRGFGVLLEHELAPGADELVGGEVEMAAQSMLVNTRANVRPWLAAFLLPTEQGWCRITALQVGGRSIDRLPGTFSYQSDGTVLLRLADPVRIGEGDDLFLRVKSWASEPKRFRATLVFVVRT